MIVCFAKIRRTQYCKLAQQQDPFAKKEQYHDGFINRAFIKFFSTKMSESLGGESADCKVFLPHAVPRAS